MITFRDMSLHPELYKILCISTNGSNFSPERTTTCGDSSILFERATKSGSYGSEFACGKNDHELSSPSLNFCFFDVSDQSNNRP